MINPAAAPTEVAFQLRDAEVGATFTTEALSRKLPPDAPRVLLDGAPRSAIVLIGGDARTVDLGSHVGLTISGEADAPGATDEAAVVYTSAMAGRPLGAILTHRNLLANARAGAIATDATADDHALAVMPFAHLFGLVVSGLTPAIAGGTVTCLDRFQPVRALECLEERGVSVLMGVPAMYAALAAVLLRRGGRLRSDRLRLCICGGAPLDQRLQDHWFELTGVELRQGYGLTEAGPVCLFNRVQSPNARGTLGHPFPGVDVAIHDPVSGEPLADECVGELCVAGENVSPGYVRDGHLGLPRRGRWLSTGDLGVRRADGTFSFRGLVKSMFTRNGFNIYPAELERVIGAMPGVHSVRVRAVPDPVRENEIAVDLTGTVSETDVKSWCDAHLSGYKQPTLVSIAPA